MNQMNCVGGKKVQTPKRNHENKRHTEVSESYMNHEEQSDVKKQLVNESCTAGAGIKHKHKPVM